MKICYVNINTEQPSKPLFSFLEKLFQQVARADTEVEIKSVDPGLKRVTDEHPYFLFLNKKQIVEKIIEAERQGYDAAIVGCFLDSGVQEARGIVNIPVIGLCESTLYFACLLGNKFGIVSLNVASGIFEIEKKIALYGLHDRAITPPVRGISISTLDVFTKGLQNPKLVVEEIRRESLKLVKEGADTVVIGCAGMGPLCTLSGVVKVGEEIPLIDCVPVGVKTAEMIVDLSKTTGLPFISRTGPYALPREKDLNRVRTIFGL